MNSHRFYSKTMSYLWDFNTAFGRIRRRGKMHMKMGGANGTWDKSGKGDILKGSGCLVNRQGIQMKGKRHNAQLDYSV